MSALSKIQDAGFTLELQNDSIKVIPSSKLSEQQRQFLKTHKAELIAELKAQQAVNDVFHQIVTCWTPSGKPINVPARDPEHAEFLKWANPKPQGKTQ